MLSLSVQSPLNNYFTYYNELSDPDFYRRSESRNVRLRISVSFSYKFGKLKEDIRRIGRGIKNDGLKGGESKEGSSTNKRGKARLL